MESSLINKLTDAFTEIGMRISRVNAGGCGKFAQRLGQTLTYLGYDVKFVILYRDYWNMIDPNEAIAQGDVDRIMENGGWVHIVTVVNGYYLDTNNIAPTIDNYQFPPCDVLVSDEIDMDFLKEMNSDRFSSKWNWAFDTSQVPMIEDILNTNLAPLDARGVLATNY